ncbi:MAG: hypothetical protein LBG96_06025 [Tannerella sp.]|nr:hypothetical protein [Tannerella sp.]
MKETISMKLFNTLQRGKEQLAKEALDRIAGFVESQRTEEDSFKDKSRKADLYYTLFGWILSYILGIRLDHKKMTSYLSRQDTEKLDLIHYAAYMRCRIVRQLMEGGKAGLLLRSLFSTEIKPLNEFDGLPHNDMQSPYTQFVWLSLLEDMGNLFRNQNSRFETGYGRSSIRDSGRDSIRDSSRDSDGDSSRSSIRDSSRDSIRDSSRDSIRDSGRSSIRDSSRDSIRDSGRDSDGDSGRAGTIDIPGSLEPYHMKGGGFMNTRDGLTATTNATVAALAVKGQLAGYKENEDLFFLRDLQEASGGFGAAKASPVPDLLSTATSLFMLSCYGKQPKYPVRDFIEAHWLDSGGFSATLLDDKSDVEYTFYGLLALGTI